MDTRQFPNDVRRIKLTEHESMRIASHLRESGYDYASGFEDAQKLCALLEPVERALQTGINRGEMYVALAEARSICCGKATP